MISCDGVTGPARRHAARGSALILAVVLTSLLAIVGVLFVMAARLDRMATSATSDSRQLDFALDTVLAEINEDLAADIPISPGNLEYYDYPDANNLWLADSEPYQSGGRYYWRQISSIARGLTGSTRNVRIRVVGEREAIVDPNTNETNADADGDGVGDARWFQVPGEMSNRGRPIYAAVRIIDNGAMLNVNTGYKFDPTEPNGAKVAGTSQLNVNVLALAGGPGDPPTLGDEVKLLSTRANGAAATSAMAMDLLTYEWQVIWGFHTVGNYPGLDPNLTHSYTPFDLSDELELRYRFLLNHAGIDTRVENWGRFRENTISTPVDSGGADLSMWFRRAAGGGLDPNYAHRSLATIYNMDRILTPIRFGQPLTTEMGTPIKKMVNVNTADELTLRAAIAAALPQLDPNAGMAEKVIQITANLRDYIDDDDEITVVAGLSSPYYGFERPCIYLSELAYRQVTDPDTGELHTSCAIELFKPYFEDNDPRSGDWKLVIDNPSTSNDVEVSIVWSGSRRFHILLADDSAAPLGKDYVAFSDPQEPADTMTPFGYNRSAYGNTTQDLGKATFESGATISLQRRVQSAGRWVVADYRRIPDDWIVADGVARSIQRDISDHKCLRRLWASAAQTSTPGLGNAIGNYVDTQRPELIQAHPANKPLKNIGELGMILARSAYSVPEGAVAADCLVDLRNPVYQRLFNYLTVIDPSQYSSNADETRIMGRININTAPSFVLAQLPWIQYDDNGAFQKANAIVDYRNARGPYQSIGELMQVDPLCALALDGKDNQHDDVLRGRGPDLTPDTALDDFEERDLIFTRISNLVTVRSDVFTAYILVRLGTDGPQKRIVATIDRSQVTSPTGKARIIAQQLVPDPR